MRILVIGMLGMAVLWPGMGCDSGDGPGLKNEGDSSAAEDLLSGTDRTGTESDVTSAEDVPPACESECEFVGKVQCSGTTGYQECIPDGACLNWSAEVSCGDNELCIDSACEEQQVEGDLECLGISQCIGQCGEEDQQCKDDCYFVHGSTQGKADFDALLVCTDDNCKELFDAQKPAAGSKCVLTGCKNEYLACSVVGNSDCGEALQCLQGCNSDNACLAQCVLSADYDSLLELTDILVCFEDKCPDPETWQECATSDCIGPVLGCTM